MNSTFVIDELVEASAEERWRHSRARSLIAQADHLPLPWAAAYRRRAQELELEAYLLHHAAA